MDFLAENLAQGVANLYEDLPDEINEVFAMQTAPDGQIWQHDFDGASRTGPRRQTVEGMGVILVSPQKHIVPYPLKNTSSLVRSH